jgi:hypothetical protein
MLKSKKEGEATYIDARKYNRKDRPIDISPFE